eukprot:Skav220200  [mRNA]  locus=scaffold1074:422200:424431:- [translate_table: standard]
MALVATTFSENQSAIALNAARSPLLKPATGVVDISIYGIDNMEFTLQKVESHIPIYVKLGPSTEPFDASRWTCAYFDSDSGRWSTDGVRLALQEELETLGFENLTGEDCCERLLDCTNINILSEENLKEILKPRWWSRVPALFLWPLLLMFVIVILVGAAVDASTHRSGLWKDEYFLTEVPPVRRTQQGLSRLVAWLL